MTVKRKRLLFIALVPLALLLIPFVAMRFSEEVNWTALDFVIAAFLLYGTALLLEFAIRKIKKRGLRLILIIALLAILLLIWIELAVGIS